MAIKSIFGNWITRIFKPSDTETTYLHKGEILVVFLIAYFIAISLWLLVNMTKEYSFTMEVPLQVTGYSEDMAFVTDPPATARVGVSGEGWNLLSLYRNPPEITIQYRDGEVNVSDVVQSQVATYTDISVQKVEPARISLTMEPKTSTRVPVRPVMDVQLKPQYEIIGRTRVVPDSVTVYGAKSVIDTLQSMPTQTLRLRNVQSPVEQKVALSQPDGLVVQDVTEVTVAFGVTEFTEAEVRVYLQARNVPDGREIRFNPTVVTVRYHVPIEQFSPAQEMVPYEAFLDYADIQRDTTGYVAPRVEAVTDELDVRLHSVQPRRVSYFYVVPD
jgi:YbbR domain-containing protein